jgi:hypothetical protein
VVPPKPVVPEATAPPGVEPTPPAPEPLRLRPRPDAGAPIALTGGCPRPLRSTSRVQSRDCCAIPRFVDDAPQGTDGKARGRPGRIRPISMGGGDPERPGPGGVAAGAPLSPGTADGSLHGSPLPIANGRNAIEAKDTLYRCLDRRRAHKEALASLQTPLFRSCSLHRRPPPTRHRVEPCRKWVTRDFDAVLEDQLDVICAIAYRA